MKIVTDKFKIDSILDRGVITNILPSKEGFREKLLKGDRIRMYIGVDPTSTALHLSHAKNYLLLEEFRQLGHEVIVLIGDFTARIGDPSERSDARKQLSKDEVKNNVDSWLNQIKPLMNFDDAENPPRVCYNNEWLAPLKFEEVINLAAHFTVQQMLERDMFEKRINSGNPIHLHEFLYPLMQGYDSVAMEVDAELCGVDQTFNALAGRTLLRKIKNRDKYVVIVNLLENPVTKEVMSKSKGTGVFLDTTPVDMYGGIMAQPDEMIEPLLINLTRLSFKEIDETKKLHPRDAKMRVAREIIEMYHGKESAREAEKQFIKTFQQKGIPQDIVEAFVKDGELLVNVLLSRNIVSSKAEFRRLVSEKAVTYLDNGEAVEDSLTKVQNATLKIGKRRFIKITLV
ncbi:MAG TPA: tyrosine--tRNA ligase [Candidatus Paceibacterota bacterium]